MGAVILECTVSIATKSAIAGCTSTGAEERIRYTCWGSTCNRARRRSYSDRRSTGLDMLVRSAKRLLGAVADTLTAWLL